jgi:hypothetical protein
MSKSKALDPATVERDEARAALRAHGLRRGVTALAKTHRRIRRCFLWVRLAMIAAAPP